jgi:hypothetical protein
VEGQGRQVLDQDWLTRLNVSRRDLATGMTPEECAAFNAQVNIAGVKLYWAAVRESGRLPAHFQRTSGPER